MNEHNILSGRK